MLTFVVRHCRAHQFVVGKRRGRLGIECDESKAIACVLGNDETISLEKGEQKTTKLNDVRTRTARRSKETIIGNGRVSTGWRQGEKMAGEVCVFEK